MFGVDDQQAKHYFENVLGKPDSSSDQPMSSNDTQTTTDAPQQLPSDLFQQTEQLLKKLESNDLSEADLFSPTLNQPTTLPYPRRHTSPTAISTTTTTNHKLDLSTPSASSLIIVLQLVLSSLRFVQRPSSKLVAINLLSKIASFSTDEARLQRIVPSLVFLLDDCDAMVRASSVRVLSYVISIVQHFPPSDAQLFPDYIFKRVSHLVNDHLVVRIAFAESIAVLAETARRFLDVNHALKLYEAVGGASSDRGSNTAPSNIVPDFPDDVSNLLQVDPKQSSKSPIPSMLSPVKSFTTSQIDTDPTTSSATLISSSYDTDLASLQETVSRWLVQITTDSTPHSSLPKRALLQDLPRLSSFFGRDGVTARILPYIQAFLNDRDDWQLRAALCDHLPSACAIVGKIATQQFVLPVIETALVDGEEQVMNRALLCLAKLVGMHLLTRSLLLGNGKSSKEHGVLMDPAHSDNPTNSSKIGLLEKYAPLLQHPSEAVRYGIVSFFCASCRELTYPDDKVFILPILKPFILYEPDTDQLQSVDKFFACLLPPSAMPPPTTPTKATKQTREKMDETKNSQNSFDDLLESVNIDDTDAAPSTSSSSSSEQSPLRIMKREVESALPINSAYSFVVPDQKFVELMTNPLPDWYNNLRNESVEEEKLLSVPSLVHVYGLTITQPSNSAQPIRKWKVDSVSMVQDISTMDNAKRSVTSDDAQPVDLILNGMDDGEWGSIACLDPSLVDASLLVSKLRCLDVPPLPPRLGVLRETDGRPFSWHGPIVTTAEPPPDTTTRSEWKPKVDSLLLSSSSTSSHTGAVTRLAVSQDNSFFVSASHDGTSRVWELRATEDAADLQSSLSYSGHQNSGENKVRINDVSIIENSHSVATAASNGSVHIWRVDMVSSKGSSALAGTSEQDRNYYTSRVAGNSLIRNVQKEEGEVFAVTHFNSSLSSLVMYASQAGCIHSWDIRCSSEPFSMSIRPELGYMTSMAVGSDRNWMVTGTNRGFLALWDLRFQSMVKLWQHTSQSPISRLATCFTVLPKDKKGKLGESSTEPKPYIFMGCGLNEASVFDITTGTCRQCFRVLDPALGYIDQASLPPSRLTLPSLNDIPIPTYSRHRILPTLNNVTNSIRYRNAPPEPSIHAIVGRIGANGHSYLLTGGTDRCIRYWDFTSPSRCYTVSGLLHEQPRPTFESVEVGNSSQLFLCRQKSSSRSGDVDGGRLAQRHGQLQTRHCNSHHDAIMDLKNVDFPVKALISASRDGTVKIWR